MIQATPLACVSATYAKSGVMSTSTSPKARPTRDQLTLAGPKQSSEAAWATITSIENAQSGELKVRIVAVPNAKGFDGRIKAGNGDWSEIQSFANSKSILFKGLTPGTVYTIEIRAVGGSTGAGDWSDPVSHMAM